MIIAITGHRPHKLGNEYDLQGPITSKIKQAIIEILDLEKPDSIISGLALGVDTLFALIGIERDMPVIAAIPFIGQETRWLTSSKSLYEKILANKLVTTKVVCEGGYAVWKMQRRNEWMVDNCDKLIAVWDGTSGGTANCVRYMRIVP